MEIAVPAYRPVRDAGRASHAAWRVETRFAGSGCWPVFSQGAIFFPVSGCGFFAGLVLGGAVAMAGVCDGRIVQSDRSRKVVRKLN